MTTARTTLRTFTTLAAASGLAAGFAALVSTLVFSASPVQPQHMASATTVHQLPRVVVTGQVQRSTQVIELPGVVVTGRRVDERAPTVVVQDEGSIEPRL